MGANYTTCIHYVNFQSLISIKTSSSVENSKPVLLSESYFYVKFCNLISTKCREETEIFLKVIRLLCLALFWFVLEGKVVSFPPSFTNHFHHLCLKMSKPFSRYELLNQSFKQNKKKLVAKSGWKSGSLSQIQLRNPEILIFKRPMEDPWNTSTHWGHHSNSIIYETAKGMRYHTAHMDVEGGHSGKGCHREVMAALEKGPKSIWVLHPCRFPLSSDKAMGILSQCR